MNQPTQFQQPIDRSWKKNLWDFFAVALGFWVGRGGGSRWEKIGVVVVTGFVLALMIWA